MPLESRNEESYEVAFSFARAWVDGTLTQAKRYRAALDRLSQVSRQRERDGTWSHRDYKLMNAADAVWVEAHLLVNAAHQLQKWGELVTDDDKENRPKSLELLQMLRNSTEHLDKAVLTADEARGSQRAAWSIQELPGGRLSLSITLDSQSPRIFDLIAVEDIERYSYLWSEVVLDHLEPDLDRVIDEQIDIYRDK